MLHTQEEIHEMKFELRQSIQRHMWRRGWKKGDLAAAAHLYPSDLSNFMNMKGARSFPISALEAIAEALQVPAGEFYPLYLGECYNNGKIVKHRCEEFLYKCALSGFDQLRDNLISSMMAESKAHVDVIFSVGKRLFDEERFTEALPLIETVIKYDANRHGQRLATCYFYRFFIVRDFGMEFGYQALVQMLEYLTYMPREIQLEAYLRIITFFNAREDLAFVWEYSKKLEELAKEGNYYAEALLYQSGVARSQGKIEEAMELTERYALVNDYYADIAQFNRLFILIHAGQTHYIDELIERYEGRDNAYIVLYFILEAYLKSGRLDKIEPFLQRFEKDVKILEQPKNPYMKKLLLLFRYYHAAYQFAIGNMAKGFEETIEAVQLANQLGNTEKLKDCLLLYRQYHEHATPVHREAYDPFFHALAASLGLIWRGD